VDKEVINLIKATNWENIIYKLTLYAKHKIDRYSWKYNKIPKGLTHEDIALEAIHDVLSNKRKLNPGKNHDLEKYLTSIIDSKISHLYELKEYQITEQIPELSEGNEFLNEINNNSNLNPEEIFFKQEKQQNDKAVADSFLKFIEGDSDLESITLYIMDGYTKPKDIANQMGIDMKRFYNLQKKFKRKCEAFKRRPDEKSKM
jgi:hypothetical protein